MQKLDSNALAALAKAHTPGPCKCALGACPGWESFTEDRWSKTQMTQLGSLRNMADHSPTQDEHHPAGTRYASSEAPIAVDFFPYNVSDVYACKSCGRLLLRYTEFGGYYVDHRVRQCRPELIV